MKEYTFVQDAEIFFNGVEQEPTLQHRIDTLVAFGANSREIRDYANKFGGYIQVKLNPIPPYK